MKRSTLRLGWGFIGFWLTWTWMSGRSYWFLISALLLVVSMCLSMEDWQDFKKGWFD